MSLKKLSQHKDGIPLMLLTLTVMSMVLIRFESHIFPSFSWRLVLTSCVDLIHFTHLSKSLCVSTSIGLSAKICSIESRLL